MLVVLLSAVPAWPQQNAGDITTKSLEELMNMEVTSASKKTETLSDAPAAIFVITGEEIRREGFSSVPDALRMVPGLYVVQQSAHTWLVSARGFSSSFNDKMLVLIDGRVVYSPTFGGVYWDVQDPLIEDIERIEVIRGPGGTLWGANAVNGVINIITKDAAKTQGSLVASTAGVNEGYATRVRYGGSIGENFSYRVYGTSNYWLPTVNASGERDYDTWTISQGSARFDWNVSSKDKVTFDGAGYSGRVRDVTEVFSPTSAPIPSAYASVVKGGHILANWKHTFSQQSSTEVLGYCDWDDRAAVIDTDDRGTCDLEVQHNYSISDRHLLTFGGGVMTTADTWPNTFTISFVPPSSRYTTYSAFAQYEVKLIPSRFRVVTGTKLEHNSYTGFEYQPQIRAVWTPNQSNTVWTAVSRAVRTPARIEESLRQRFEQVNPTPPPLTFTVITGQPSAESEILHAYELGYRYDWRNKFSADAAVYYNGYSRLSGLSATGSPIVNASPVYIDIPLLVENQDRGQTHGLEIAASYAPIQHWTVSTAINELRGNSTPSTGFPALANNPEFQIAMQSRITLRHENLDALWFHNDSIRDVLPALNRVDLGVSTNRFRGFNLSVWGRNLQQDHHAEAIPQTFLGGEIRRSVVFKLVWEPEANQVKGKN